MWINIGNLGELALKTRLLILLSVILTITFRSYSFSLVIDPGHGGKDYGASGVLTNEKSINLAVSKLVAEMLSKDNKDVEIIMTRSTDKYLSLKERADIANASGGDLFVSIHVNSVDKKNKNRTVINGASVYTLGLHKSDANFEVAKRENSVISLDPDSETSYEGFDPSSAESYIIFELSQNKHMGQSINVAQQIQKELIKTAGRGDRGVRQAGFWVLWATSMPSVLIELDFICNPDQEKFMASKAGQKKMASAIAKALGSYIASHSETSTASGKMILQSENSIEPVSEETVEEMVEIEEEIISGTGEITYHVQILASIEPVKNGSKELKGQKPDFYKDGDWNKYYVGNFTSIDDAKKLLTTIRKDFPKAFIIKLKDGKRITE